MIVRILSTKANAIGQHEEIISFEGVCEVIDEHPVYKLKSDIYNSDVYIECPVGCYVVVNKGEENESEKVDKSAVH